MKRYIVEYDNGMKFQFLSRKQCLDYIKDYNLNIDNTNANCKIFDSNKKRIGYFIVQNLKDYLCLGGEMNGNKCDSMTVKGHGYIMFNAGSGNSTKHSAVFIHESLL